MPNADSQSPATSAARWAPTGAGATKIALGYAVIGAVWIISSDQIVHRLIPNGELEVFINTCKGWFFVGMTAALLWFALNHYFRQIRRAGRLLQESEQRWQFALDGAGHGVWDWDAQTNQVFYSTRFKSMLGYAPDEFGADLDAWKSRVHPNDLAQVMAVLQSHVEDRTSMYITEHRIQCKDGSFKWVLGQGKIISRTAAGKPLRAIGTHTDISARKQAEEELATEAIRRRILVDQSRDGIVVLDEAGRVYEANQRYTEMLGYSTAEIRTLYIWDWEAQWNRDEILRIVQRVGAAGEIFETRHRRKNASIFDVEISVNGAVIGGQKLLFCVCRDITERKKAEAQLRSSEERFRKLVEAAPEAIYIRTAKNFAYVNPAAVRLFGEKSPEQLLGTPVLERFHPDSRVLTSELMHRLDKHHQPSSELDHLILRPDGSSVTAVISATPLLYNEQPSSLGFARDMTAYRQLEAQLRQAQKLEAVGQLAGGVAHDFNNILAATMMHLGLLQMNPALDAATHQTLKELEEENRRAVTLTRQLLMFSRRSALEIKPLDLNELVANLLKMLTRLIGENIDLRPTGQACLPLVAADAGMLEQVLMNLIVNARDALPQGGHIAIRTTTVNIAKAQADRDVNRRPGRFVCLAVSDTGCGMNSEILKHIFEPFFTTKEAGKGTGLGLATVHGIVAQHNGWVEVDSKVGHGTTFAVFLPAADAVASRAAAERETTSLPRGVETILLVEDDTKVRQITGQFLRILGYRVIEASNGLEALTVWEKHGSEVDLLLTDMIMPEGMTGAELTEQLQSHRPGLKVIITSGYSSEIAHAGVPRKPGVLYLPKPHETKKLADAVRRCLDQKN